MVTWQVEAFIIDYSHTTLQSVKLRYSCHMTVKQPFKVRNSKQYYNNQDPVRFLVSYHRIDVRTLYRPAMDVGWLTVWCKRSCGQLCCMTWRQHSLESRQHRVTWSSAHTLRHMLEFVFSPVLMIIVTLIQLKSWMDCMWCVYTVNGAQTHTYIQQGTDRLLQNDHIAVYLDRDGSK